MKGTVLGAEIANMNSKLLDAATDSTTMNDKCLMKAEANIVPTQSGHPNSAEKERDCERSVPKGKYYDPVLTDQFPPV